jgi:hypothetical protein
VAHLKAPETVKEIRETSVVKPVGRLETLPDSYRTRGWRILISPNCSVVFSFFWVATPRIIGTYQTSPLGTILIQFNSPPIPTIFSTLLGR